jgi:hypothetical protein
MSDAEMRLYRRIFEVEATIVKKAEALEIKNSMSVDLRNALKGV